MTTTTGDPSTLKTPATLSGGDLVSRLLAATPPYLYNVPLTPHSFFFSEMLRSFVQAKAEATSSTSNSGNTPRRRKRSWRDVRDRPLELTTKERNHHHHHHNHNHNNNHHNHHQSQQDKYYHGQAQQLSQQQLDSRLENRTKQNETYDTDNKINIFDQKANFGGDMLKSIDDTKSEFVKQTDQKKLDFSMNFLPGLPGRGCEVFQGVKGFGLPGNVTNSEFLPSPLWYPPYPMPQSYPGIDPLRFFIDLRVSGHIWDRKMNERQLPFKSKHCSAFSVPQSKEYGNRPLNLTRDEASTSRTIDENIHGTNYILKHLSRTYKDIQKNKISRQDTSVTENDEIKQGLSESEDSTKQEDASNSSGSKEDDRKDLRAVIGLELVVDYVKEPKGDPSRDNEQAARVNTE
ncbi:hypothetical protein M0802_013922 [Mischocyttarus mexicanus]|nr:hypothetical protein M0802_013926 [Mischocyttarus mexicanus]KAI4481583.1 hypothetical protein M0802_013922 [Mischocyttarus mexicanus]